MSEVEDVMMYTNKYSSLFFFQPASYLNGGDLFNSAFALRTYERACLRSFSLFPKFVTKIAITKREYTSLPPLQFLFPTVSPFVTFSASISFGYQFTIHIFRCYFRSATKAWHLFFILTMNPVMCSIILLGYAFFQQRILFLPILKSNLTLKPQFYDRIMQI